MLFSIIIPVYNVQEYLTKSIDNVLAQTLNDYEILIVDDGSFDKSSVICERYLNDANVKVIHQVNQGSSAARNAGMKAAQGDYLIFLDSDDYWNDKSFLEKMRNIISGYNPDFLQYSYTNFVDGEEPLYYKNNETYGIKEFSTPYELLIYNGFRIAAWTKMIKRTIVVDNGVYFKVGITGEDIDWFLNILPHIQSSYYVDIKVVCYRVRSGSITHRRKSKKTIYDTYEMLRRHYTNFIQMKLPEYENTCLMTYLAYQYYILIACAQELEGYKEEFYSLAKGLQPLTRYAATKKTRLCRIVYNLFGIRISAFIFYRYIIDIRK